MNIDVIDGMCRAIAAQCGLFASVKRCHHDSGTTSTVVQVCTDKQVGEGAEWLFFEAQAEDELSRVRDELADFIAEHRQEAAA